MVARDGAPVVLAIDKLGFHLLSTVLLIVWVVVVGATVGLLERAVVVSRQSVSIPWHYRPDGLPSLLVTLVAQAHGGITTMHLARLAVSGLCTSLGHPYTWIEMFWLSKGKWSGPVGMLETLWSLLRRSTRRISFAFVLFTLIMATALALPLVLERAYPASTIDVTVAERLAFVTPNDAGSNFVGAYAQVVTGGGGWSTGQSVITLFNRTTYIPAGTPRGNSSNDMFFAGDVLGRDATLPGILIRGSCVDTGADRDALFANGLDEKVAQVCKDAIPVDETRQDRIQISVGFNISWCSHLTVFEALQQPPRRPKSIIIFGYTAEWVPGLGEDSSSENKRGGITRCETTTLVGHASLNGRDLTYTNFVADTEVLKFAHGDEHILEPFSAVLDAINENVGERFNNIQRVILEAYLGMSDSGVSILRMPPTPQRFSETMWIGGTHMAAALAILSRRDTTKYDAITHHAVSGYKRIDRYFYAVLALLGLWLAGLAVASGLFLRRTFNDTLDEYVAARLLAQRPDLVAGVPAGSPDDNEKLKQRFDGIELRAGVSDDLTGVELLEPGQMSPTENAK